MGNKTIEVKTPVGELAWVFIDGDGKNTAEKPTDEPVWKRVATLHLLKGSEKCDKLIAKIDAVWEELKVTNAGIKKATLPKSLGYKEVKDKETDEPTGVIAFSFSTNSFWKKDNKPNFVQTLKKDGSPLELNDIKIGNGSRGMIHSQAGLYEYKGTFGISLYLNGIQLTKLVPYTGTTINAEEIDDDEVGEDEDDGMSMLNAGKPPIPEDDVEV